MTHIKLTTEDRQELSILLNKIVGQLQSLNTIIVADKINDSTFTQLLAAKGGISRVCKNIIAKGVLTQLDKYTKEELNYALDLIFKLDK